MEPGGLSEPFEPERIVPPSTPKPLAGQRRLFGSDRPVQLPLFDEIERERERVA